MKRPDAARLSGHRPLDGRPRHLDRARRPRRAAGRRLPHQDHVAFTLAGEARADDARMLALLEPFRPYRGRVLAAILTHGAAAPRFGPRLSVRDIRGA